MPYVGTHGVPSTRVHRKPSLVVPGPLAAGPCGALTVGVHVG